MSEKWHAYDHLCTFCASSSEVGSPSSSAPSSFYHIVTEIWMVNSVDLLLAWETFPYTAYRTIWFQTKGKMGYVPSIFKYVLNIFKEYFRLHDREGTESCLVWTKERVDKHFVNFFICPCQITSLLTCNITAVPSAKPSLSNHNIQRFCNIYNYLWASLSVLLVTQQLPRNWAGCNRLTLTLTFIWESVLIWLLQNSQTDL